MGKKNSYGSALVLHTQNSVNRLQGWRVGEHCCVGSIRKT